MPKNGVLLLFFSFLDNKLALYIEINYNLATFSQFLAKSANIFLWRHLRRRPNKNKRGPFCHFSHGPAKICVIRGQNPYKSFDVNPRPDKITVIGGRRYPRRYRGFDCIFSLNSFYLVKIYVLNNLYILFILRVCYGIQSRKLSKVRSMISILKFSDILTFSIVPS